MKQRVAFVFAMLALLIGTSIKPTALASPFSISLPFKRVDADPQKTYPLREEHGPWLIVAASFLGERGERQAHQLVYELRKRYKLHAYVYKKRFDNPDMEIGLGVDSRGRPKKMRPIHAVDFDEIAVLVGDFDSVDDSKAQKTLEKIKYLRPDTLAVGRTQSTNQRMAVWREIQKRISPDPQQKKKGPMGSAFITRNPVLPEEFFVRKGPDTTILELNKGIEFSLLDCPAPYTVKVASFRGEATWNLSEIERAQRGGWGGQRESKLVEAAQKATRLTQALRRQGVEAYQFHDRHESVVTVGSFDWVSMPRADGKDELNPAVHKIMQQYGAKQLNLPWISNGMRLQNLDGIPFDAQPLPVQVPRVSVASQYTQSGRSYR